MKKRLSWIGLVLVIWLLLPVVAWTIPPALLHAIGNAPVVCTYVALDTGDFTEVDATGDLTINSATQITWVNLDRANDTYLYRDFGAAYFAGDFSFRFVLNITLKNVATYAFVFMLANGINDFKYFDDLVGETADVISFFNWGDATPNNDFKLSLLEDSAWTTDVWENAAANGTDYYITITRDDDAGVNGTGRLTAYIRTTSHTGTLQDTLILDCAAGEQNDFQYLYLVNTYNSGDNWTQSGVAKNWEYKLCID